MRLGAGKELMTAVERTERGAIDVVVFDVGGVLVDWDPRHLYRKIFSDADRMESFLGEVCTPSWHAQHDLGVPLSSSIPALVSAFPEWSEEIHAWEDRFEEMWNGPVPGSVEVFAALRASNSRVPIYAATNWGSDNWRIAKTLFPFLHWFDGEVVSGDVQLLKPDPRFFDLLVRRFNLTPSSTLYVDDNPENVRAASQKGLVARHFTSPERLASLLEDLGLIP
ncbi:MAG: HAD-IA family hydrolase [Acidimicrobiales bacterium]|jgi:2-haloacid dehalogenase